MLQHLQVVSTYMLEFNGTDLVGNVGSELTVTGIVFDGAAPTFVKAWQYDTDGNGNIDEIVVELSEAVSDASVVLWRLCFRKWKYYRF